MKATIVAFWSYQGNHSEGRDHERRGDLKLAGLASEYHRQHGNDTIVQRIPPSRAGCRAEISSFGRTFAYRIADMDALIAFGKTIGY